MEKELIAERTIFAVDQHSREFEMRLTIGKPYPSSRGDWACPVSMIGLHGTFPDMYGIDSWQALMNVRNLLHDLLRYFVEDGGKLYWEKGGEELKIEELFGHWQEDRVPDGPLTTDELRRVESLTAEELQRIDNAIMSHATRQWRKAAMLVGLAIDDNRDSIKNVSDIFYAQRLRRLVEAGLLESDGNLDYMRFSEVRRAP